MFGMSYIQVVLLRFLYRINSPYLKRSVPFFSVAC